jgi:hypothetical protein
MKRKAEMYPFAYIFKGKKTILIWQTNGRDTFKKLSDNRLLQSATTLNMKKLLRTEAAQVHWSEQTEVDFDKFWTTLKNLRSNRSSSRTTCSVLLAGWNFIEDMGRTFNFKNDMKRLRSKPMYKAYEKIFYGCNLSSVTPEGKSYSPLWINKEIAALRAEFRTIWELFRSKGYIQP